MSEKNNQHDSRQTSGRSDITSIASGEGGRLDQVLAKEIPAGVFRADADGTCSYVNGRWCEMAGITADRAISGGWIQAIHPDDRMKVVDAWHTSVRDRRRFFMEFRFRRPDGTTRWVLEEAITEQDADGKITGYLAIVTDISHSKQTEEEYQRFFDLIPDLACIASADGRFLKVNPMWQEVLGYQEHELLSRPFLDFIHPDDREATMAQVKQQLAGEPTLNFTNRYRCKDGSYKWLEWKATPAVDGKLLFASARDITGRKNLEEEKQEALDMLRKIASQVPGIVYQFRLHPDGRTSVPYASEATREIYRINPEEVREDAGKVFAHAHPDDLEGFRASIEESAKSLAPWQHEYRLKFDDGTVRWVYGNAIPQREADGSTLWHGFLTDITGRIQAEQAMAESESRFREIFNAVSDAIFIHDAETGRIVDVNRRMCKMYGVTREEALACGPDDLSAGVPPYSSAEAIEKIRLARTMGPQTFDWLARTRDGRYFWAEVSLRLAQIGNYQRILAVVRDISERKHVDMELRIAAIAFESQDGMLITDIDNVILRVNHAFTEITGYTAEEAVGQTPRLLRSDRHDADFYAAMWEVIRRTGSWHGEVWNRRKNGEEYPEQLTITAVKSDEGDVSHYVAIMRDISQRKAAEEEIYHLAFYDALTRLPNRRLLDDRLRQAMAAGRRSGLHGALMFIDLDNFKPLNDNHGHDVGDMLLVEAARRIAGCVREMDTVARFGGDEFVVMLGELEADKAESGIQAGLVAEKIRATLAEPYRLTYRHGDEAETTVEHRCAASIGVALFIGQQSSPEDVLKWADMAMYHAKQGGRNRVHFHVP